MFKSTMLSRLPVLSLQYLYRKKSHFNLHLASFFEPKYQFSSSSPNIIPSLNSEYLKNIQFSKHTEPLANQSVDQILSDINPKSLSSDKLISTLKVLRMHTIFKNTESNCFKEDERFKIICQVFERNCNSFRPNLLVSGLRSLLEVGVPPDSSVVISAERSIINNINLFTTFNIIGCLYFHHKHMETDLQKNVVSLLVTELSKKAFAISTTAELLMLVHFLHIFSEENTKIIEQKIIQLIPLLQTHEMCKVLSTLAENSVRNIFILNAVSFLLRQKIEIPEMKEVLSILYSFKKLNFHDAQLLSYLLEKIVPEIPSVTQPSVISGILTTCGHLRWKQNDILMACGQWISLNLDSCRSKEFTSFILTAATLNHNNKEVQKILLTILPLVKYEDVESPNVWLDIVWALAILNFVDKEMLLKVLSPEFYMPLIDGSGFQTVTNKLKLMNLKAVLKMSHPECIFGCDLYLQPAEIPQSTEIVNCRKHVITVMNNFIPRDKYMYINQNTDIGVFVDAEFIMTSNIKPLLLSKYGTMSKATNTTPLPKDSQRIALLTLFYKDYTRHTTSVTGCVALASRLLSAQGYTVVSFPFMEFIRLNTEVKKAKYILQKITTAMKITEEKYVVPDF